MKIYFMKQPAVDFFRTNMDRLYVNYFQKSDNSWMAEAFGEDPFVLLMDIPGFELASLTDGRPTGEIDVENCKKVYENLKDLSESQASDERLWAGICNGTFYSYMRRRHGYTTMGLTDKEKDVGGIISRFFFSGGTRAGFYRNTLAKCWWVGRATYDRNNQVNKFQMLDDLGANDISTKVSDIFFSNTFASNPTILKGICDAFRHFTNEGIKLRMREEVRPALQYLNAVGGVTLLDALSPDEIKEILISKINELLNGIADGLSIELNDSIVLEGTGDNEVELVEEQTNDEMNHEEINDKLVIQDIEEEEIADESEPEEVEREKPETVCPGCYIKVYVQSEDIVETYNIPKDADSKDLSLVEKKMLNKKVGFTMYLQGSWMKLVDFGWL